MADRAVRSALVLAAVSCVLLGAPGVLTTAVVAAASLAVIGHLAARRRLGGADALLVGVGGLLSALVVTGLALDLVGVPLRPTGWALALGGLGLGALLLTRSYPGRPAEVALPLCVGAAGAPALTAPELTADTPIAPGVRGGALLSSADTAWALACAVVLVVAVTLSVRSVAAVEVSPVQLSVQSIDGVRVQVQVSSDTATGPLELRADTGDGAALSYPLFRLPAGGTRTTEVLVPATGRARITLNNPGQSQPLRSLVVDR